MEIHDFEYFDYSIMPIIKTINECSKLNTIYSCSGLQWEHLDEEFSTCIPYLMFNTLGSDYNEILSLVEQLIDGTNWHIIDKDCYRTDGRILIENRFINDIGWNILLTDDDILQSWYQLLINLKRLVINDDS